PGDLLVDRGKRQTACPCARRPPRPPGSRRRRLGPAGGGPAHGRLAGQPRFRIVRRLGQRQIKGDRAMTGPMNRIDGVQYEEPGRASESLANGAWMYVTVGDMLRQTAARLSDKMALLTDSGSVTFGELDELTDRLAAALLDLGLRPADRAIFQMGNNVETAGAVVACLEEVIVPVCAILPYREVEIGQLSRLSQARGYFVQSASPGSFDMVGF